jgi:hypothetical protein
MNVSIAMFREFSINAFYLFLHWSGVGGEIQREVGKEKQRRDFAKWSKVWGNTGLYGNKSHLLNSSRQLGPLRI